LLVMETLPVALPVAEGANCALKVVFCPAARVSGTDKPVMLKPVPEVLAAEIVTLAVPELLNVKICVPLLPTSTLLKLKLEGLAVSVPCTPVPLNAIAAGDPGALLLMEMFPESLPVDPGRNCAVKETLEPALIVCGKVKPVRLNPVPEGVA
jgi:hypothetical protein